MQPKQPYSLGKRSRYPAIFLVAVIVLAAGIFLVVPSAKQPDFFMPAIAAAAGFAYFLYSQHLQETRLFTDLFRQFNERYDKLNAHLNRIAAAGDQCMLASEDKQILFDYFNLCAEEYLYFKNGFIDPEVWRSWLNGMRYYAAVSCIKKLWLTEIEGGSYYGFQLKLVEGKA